MKQINTKAKIGHSRSVLTEKLLRLFRADATSSAHIVGQTDAQKSPHEEARTATLNADQARANAMMEWQKHRPLSQTL